MHEGRAARAAGVAAVAVLLAAAVQGAAVRRGPPFPLKSGEAWSGPALDAAVARAKARLEKDPDDLESRVELGVLYRHAGAAQAPDAINELERARQLGSTDPRIPYYLGVLYQSEGLYPFAVREFKRYLRNHADDRDARLLLAKILYQTGRYGEAAALYRGLLEKDPDDALVAENLGLSRLGAREYAAARESFAVLLRAGGDSARRARYYLGNAHLAEGRPREALAAYAQALPPGGREVAGLPATRVRSAVALALERMGRHDLALENWERVAAADPGDLQARARVLDLRSRLALPRGVAGRPASDPPAL